jgi:hypothetical protein
MSIGAFFAGILLGIVCMFRINVRAFQWMEARRPWLKRPTLDPTNIILGIKLRNTFVLEVIGLIVAIVTLGIVIELDGPGLRWSVPRP